MSWSSGQHSHDIYDYAIFVINHKYDKAICTSCHGHSYMWFRTTVLVTY
jgi:hypothetical protein